MWSQSGAEQNKMHINTKEERANFDLHRRFEKATE